MRLDPITLSSNSEIQSQPNTPFFPFCVALKSYGQVTLGGHSTSDPPLPISNRTVKRSRADDSAPTVCESRSPPGSPTYKAPHRSKHCGALRFTRHDSNLQTCCWSHDPPRANLDEKPLTGEPCAGEPHARFGGRGARCPYQYRRATADWTPAFAGVTSSHFFVPHQYLPRYARMRLMACSSRSMLVV